VGIVLVRFWTFNGIAAALAYPWMGIYWISSGLFNGLSFLVSHFLHGLYKSRYLIIVGLLVFVIYSKSPQVHTNKFSSLKEQTTISEEALI
jgi:hypothetical protein